MEEVISKLSEIEATAKNIMAEAEKTKQSLSDDLEKQFKEFDGKIDARTEEKIAAIRKQLESDKESEVKKLRQETKKRFADMELYYEENHEKLAEEIFNRIVAP